MSHVISPHQTAYIAGRYIGENTRLLFDTIALANEKNIPGMIVTADFEAAFESVSWEYLKEVMSQMNFGPYFQNLIDLLYLNPNNYSRIMINMYLGPKVFLRRGTRQGDPSSGYLFNIAAEVLTGVINQSTKLKGISISASKQIRISQYADDTLLFLDGSSESVKGAMGELSAFGHLSGLKVNTDKTFCLPIGTLKKQQVPTNLNITIVDELNVLGTVISAKISNVAEKILKVKYL